MKMVSKFILWNVYAKFTYHFYKVWQLNCVHTHRNTTDIVQFFYYSSQSQRRRMNENTLRILQRQWDPSGPLQIKKSSICLFSHGNSGVTVISKKVIAIDHKGRNNLLLTINLQSFITSAGWLHCVCHRHAWAAGRVKREQHWQWVCLIDFSLYKSYVNKCVRFNFNPIKKQ